MSDQTTNALIELAATVSNLGGPALLVLILWSGYKQYWVWGRSYREMQADRDFWRSTALRLANIAEQTVSVVSKSEQQR